MKKGRKEIEQKNRKWVPIRLVLFVTSLFLITVFYQCFKNDKNVTYASIPGDSILNGALPNTNTDELKRRLQEQADRSQMSIHINSCPVFKKNGLGNLRIENPVNSYYNQRVEIYLDDGQRKVYESPIIHPNQYIETDILSVELDKGIYEATAFFIGLNAETGEEVGRAAAKITIRII